MNADNTFACPGCAKRFVWNPQLAGRRVNCKCGQVFTIPAPIGPQDRPAVVAPAPPAPTSNSAATPANPLAEQMQRYGVRQRVVVEEEDLDAGVVRNLYLPAALLTFALALRFGHVIIRPAEQGALYSVARAFFELIINLAAVFAGAVAAIQFLGVSPGPLGRSVLKLLAIAIFALAVSELIVTLDPRNVPLDGMHLALLVNMFLFWMGFFVFFRSLDMHESMMTVVIITLLQLASNLFIWSTREGKGLF